MLSPVLSHPRFGLGVFGPQCSLWLTYMSQPNHQRGKLGVRGDFSGHAPTYLSNIINENTATYLLVLYHRQVAFALEQPGATYYMEYDTTKRIIAMLGLDMYFTWMKCYGHWMPKPSRLIGSMVGLAGIVRVWSKKRWDRRKLEIRNKLKKIKLKFRRVFASRSMSKRKRSANSAWTSVPKPSGHGNWITGGQGLKDSGSYTLLFCDTLLALWETSRFDLPEPVFNIEELLTNMPFPMHYYSCPPMTGKKKKAKNKTIQSPRIPDSWCKPCKPTQSGPTECSPTKREYKQCMIHDTEVVSCLFWVLNGQEGRVGRSDRVGTTWPWPLTPPCPAPWSWPSCDSSTPDP